MKIVLGVTGCIAAYKAPSIVSGLLATGNEVVVVMTQNATRFIDPRCFKVKTLWGMWERESGDIPHIELANWAEAFVVAPATANIIGKFANGIADDLLSTNHLALSETVVKIIYPAMNTNMLVHPAVQQNMKTLFSRGWDVQAPEFGMLQCGVEGEGKLAKERSIVEHVNEYLKNNDPTLGSPLFGAHGRRWKETIEGCRQTAEN